MLLIDEELVAAIVTSDVGDEKIELFADEGALDVPKLEVNELLPKIEDVSAFVD